MSATSSQQARYAVSIFEPEESSGALLFTFTPKGIQGDRVTGPKRVPQFVATVRHAGAELVFDWSGTLDDPGSAREELEAEISARMKDRESWIARETSLVLQMEKWAREMGWSTRRIEKKLDDARIGRHQVSALLMQQGTCRALVEPIARSTPGTDGVVDLYLMPAYDDIASLYYYGDRWNVHYNTFRGTNAVVPVRESEAMPLSKETLEKVLAEMIRHAA